MMRKINLKKEVGSANLFKRGLICIFLLLLVILSCQLVSGEALSPSAPLTVDPALPECVYINAEAKINWNFPYNFTCTKYYLTIVDPFLVSMHRSEDYLINDKDPGKNSPLTGSDVWIVPENSSLGTYFAKLTINSEEAGGGIELELIRYFCVNIGGNLSILKFKDTNHDGKHDAGEFGLPGWKFNIITPDGKSYSETTDSGGSIYMDNVPEGEYVIQEILKPEQKDMGWYNTTPLERTETVEEGKTTNVLFGNSISRVIIIKFNDTNQNGKVDDGVDERLRGWEFNVTDPKGKTTKYTTDNNGEIKIEVPPGNYIIEEILKGDWSAITSTKQTKKVVEGKTTLFEFLNKPRPPTWLLIQKFNDTNQNGKVDDGVDERLRGWEFKVTDPGGKTTTHFTNDIGEKRIEIPIGYEGKDYTIEEILKHNWTAITSTKQTKNVLKGNTATVQFLNTLIPQTLLLIQKFNDTNKNSEIDDADDKEMPGWEFQVTYPDGKTSNYITDGNGEIKIEVPPGNYIIEEILKGDWRAITSTKQAKNVLKGNTATVQFLNTPQGDLTIIKFYDPNQNRVQDPGEQGLAWNFSIMFPDGGIKRIRTDENGRYPLRNIPVGKYEITEEPRGCRWTSTKTTPKVLVKPGKEARASFGNYIVNCSIPPGCPWFNEDENLNVSKSVDPCECNITPLREGESTSKEVEPEVSVYLRVCVDKRLIKDGIAVENIKVVETLHNHFTIVGDSFSEQPRAIKRNPDGTTTLEWDIPSLCCEEWRVSFNVTATFALPIDVTDTSERITSKVIYEDPIETGRRELSIPEGKLKFSFIVPPPPIWCYVLGGLLVLSISIEITLELKRRKKEKSKEKEKE